jgi:hypothetical protein
MQPTGRQKDDGDRGKRREQSKEKIVCEQQEYIKNEYKHKSEVVGPRACAWAAKIDKRQTCSIYALEAKEKGRGVKPPRIMVDDKQFILTGEPLYGGKGKRSGLTSNHCDSAPIVCDHVGEQPRPEEKDDEQVPKTELYPGLNQPRLIATDNVVPGEDKANMRRKNKHQ